MMSRMRKFVGIIGLAILASGAGLVSGSAVQATMSSPPVVASCEQDECEGGSSCTANSGNDTTCDMTGDNKCETGACESSDDSWELTIFGISLL